MIDIKFILNNKAIFIQKSLNRGLDLEFINSVIDKSFLYLEQLQKIQKLENKRNILSKDIGIKKAKNIDITLKIKEVNQINDQLDFLQKNKITLDFLDSIPNIIDDQTPIGKTEIENKVIFENKNLGKGLIKDVVPHYELAEQLKIINFKNAIDLSGSRFWAYENEGSKLLRAIINFLLDFNTSKGYKEINVPLIVKPSALYGVGQLPKFQNDVFQLTNGNYLISTTEVPLTCWYQNKIIDLEKPICLTSYSQCFRSEAGSSGKDLKGIIRGHQFNKVELVKITSQEDSEHEYQKMINDVEDILIAFELPYRKLQLCSGDLGFSATKTVDFEVWMPSENKYREISSVSHCKDFQARRAMIRYKKDGKNKYAHTMNGSGVAIDRLIAAIIENYQDKTQKFFYIPKILNPYFHKKIAINHKILYFWLINPQTDNFLDQILDKNNFKVIEIENKFYYQKNENIYSIKVFNLALSNYNINLFYDEIKNMASKAKTYDVNKINEWGTGIEKEIKEKRIHTALNSIFLKYKIKFDPKNQNILTFISEIFFKLLKNHFFINGNKRTASLWLNFVLKKIGFEFIYWKENKSYEDKLVEFITDNSIYEEVIKKIYLWILNSIII